MIEPKERVAWLKMMEAKIASSIALSRLSSREDARAILSNTFDDLLTELREAWGPEKEKP